MKNIIHKKIKPNLFQKIKTQSKSVQKKDMDHAGLAWTRVKLAQHAKKVSCVDASKTKDIKLTL